MKNIVIALLITTALSSSFIIGEVDEKELGTLSKELIEIKKAELEKDILNLELDLLKKELKNNKIKNAHTSIGKKKSKFKTFIEENPLYIDFESGYFNVLKPETIKNGIVPHAITVSISPYFLFRKKILFGFTSQKVLSTDLYKSPAYVIGSYGGITAGAAITPGKLRIIPQITAGIGDIRLLGTDVSVKEEEKTRFFTLEGAILLAIDIKEHTAIGIKPYYTYTLGDISDMYGVNLTLSFSPTRRKY